MDLWIDDETETSSDPMDTVEAVIGSDERFQCERAEDGDMHFSFKSSWGESVGYFSFRHELPALLFTLGFEIQAPVSRRSASPSGRVTSPPSRPRPAARRRRSPRPSPPHPQRQ